MRNGARPGRARHAVAANAIDTTTAMMTYRNLRDIYSDLHECWRTGIEGAILREAPWSAAAKLPPSYLPSWANHPGREGGSFAAALHQDGLRCVSMLRKRQNRKTDYALLSPADFGGRRRTEILMDATRWDALTLVRFVVRPEPRRSGQRFGARKVLAIHHRVSDKRRIHMAEEHPAAPEPWRILSGNCSGKGSRSWE